MPTIPFWFPRSYPMLTGRRAPTAYILVTLAFLVLGSSSCQGQREVKAAIDVFDDCGSTVEPCAIIEKGDARLIDANCKNGTCVELRLSAGQESSVSQSSARLPFASVIASFQVDSMPSSEDEYLVLMSIEGSAVKPIEVRLYGDRTVRAAIGDGPWVGATWDFARIPINEWFGIYVSLAEPGSFSHLTVFGGEVSDRFGTDIPAGPDQDVVTRKTAQRISLGGTSTFPTDVLVRADGWIVRTDG